MTQKEQIKELTDKIDTLANNQKRILYLLENDDTTGTKGLVAEVRDLKAQMGNFSDWVKISKAKATVWGMVGTVIIGGIFWFVKLVVAKFV